MEFAATETEEERAFKKFNSSTEGRYIKHRLVQMQVGHVVYLDEKRDDVVLMSKYGRCANRTYKVNRIGVGVWRLRSRVVRVRRVK